MGIDIGVLVECLAKAMKKYILPSLEAARALIGSELLLCGLVSHCRPGEILLFPL